MANLLFNSDGGSGVLYAYEPPINAEKLCRVVNALEGTGVSTFIQCVSFVSHLIYGTNIGEIYGDNLTEFENENFRRLAHNIKSILNAGHDPLNIWAARTHELGMQFWPSLRMNDIHKDWVERWPSLRTRWELERPYVAIGKDFPARYQMRYPDHTYTWAFDYACAEVRDLKFNLIDEICSNYDVEGIELDFLSHPYYFKQNMEADGAGLLTDFMRRIRQRLNKIGRLKGRPLTLSARVLPTLALSMEAGLDVKSWIENALIDVVVPSTRGYLDGNADIMEYVKLARQSSCRIAGSISDLWVTQYQGKNPPRASIEMMRATAASLWEQGVKNLHVFNYDCHATGIQHHNSVESIIDADASPLFSAEEYEILTEIGERKSITGKDKHYFITCDMLSRTAANGGEMQLPADIERGATHSIFTFMLGNDPETVREDCIRKQSRLVLTLDSVTGIHPEAIEIEFNGVILVMHPEEKTLYCNEVPYHSGRNQLKIFLKTNAPAERIRLIGIELLINYS